VTGEGTRAVHGPARRAVRQTPLVPPIYRSSTFVFENAQQMADVFAGGEQGWSYSRTDNPTAQAFADAVAALEAPGAVGQPFVSGSAAVASTFMALCSSGSHLVVPQEVYGGTWTLLTNQLARFGVTTSFVDMTDPAAVQLALRPETALVWGEVMANPSMTVTDLPAISAIARSAGIPFVVDATFASPAICRPIEHGADLVVHSATKYFGGHSDVTGGVVVGRPDLIALVRAVRIDLGGSLGPDDAALLLRGLQTLPLRVARQCESALALATAAAAHRKVKRVDYPGLADHQGHALATKLFDKGRYGAIVTVTVGSRNEGMKLVDSLELIALATSLGGTVSKAVHVPTTTHKSLDAEALAAAGIGPGTVRISVGLEDADDLIADLTQALNAL
jgi:cystathionine beta-lyase/cystathionine gamma-synthase